MKKIKRIMAIFLCILMMIGVALPFGSFSATALVTSTPGWYNADATELTVNSEGDFLAFIAAIKDGNTFEGQTVKLTKNIAFDATDAKTTDLGGKCFAGVFDGQGYSIKGYKNSSAKAQGMFGNVAKNKSATVKNVAFVNCSMTLTADVHVFGGIFGDVQGSVNIDNVYNDIDVTTTDGTGKSYGGFVGIIREESASDAVSTITNSVYVGTITTNNAATASFVGEIGKFSSLTIKNCAAYGSVTGDGVSQGVIIGRASGNSNVLIDTVIASGEIALNATQRTDVVFGHIRDSGKIEIKNSIYTLQNYDFLIYPNREIDAEYISLDELKTDVPTGFIGRADNTPIPAAIANFAYVEQGHVCIFTAQGTPTETEHFLKCSVTGCPSSGATFSASHFGGNATCQEQAVCDECNTEYGELGEHTGGTATCVVKAKCERCGNEYGEFASHKMDIVNYRSDENTHYFGCKTDGCTHRVSEAEHVYDEGTVKVAATADSEGEMLYECLDCGYKHTAVIEKLSASDTSNQNNASEGDSGNNADEKRGCGSAVIGSMGIVALVAFGACVTAKKKEDN